MERAGRRGGKGGFWRCALGEAGASGRVLLSTAESSMSQFSLRACCIDGCGVASCTLFGPRYLCLLHFVAVDEDGVAVVSNNDELVRQSSAVKDLWNEAITEVTLEMFELQKKEEDSLRKDPLSILTMNSKTSKGELKRKFGSQSMEQVFASGSQEGQSSKPSTNKRPAANHQQDQPREKRHFKLLSSHLSSDDGERMKKIIDERNMREREGADGEACRKCGSRWTFKSELSGYDITKSEVWGNKDTPDVFSITCKECLFVSTETR